jgi:superfamily II DNA or RNA helicase
VGEIRLRPYQEEGVASLMEIARQVEAAASEKPTAERVLAVQPTGSGKTVLFLELARRVLRQWQWRTLIVVPTRELVAQTIERAAHFIPEAEAAAMQQRRGKKTRQISSVMVSTSAGLNARRLEETSPDSFQLVVIDEAHHVAAASCAAILKHFSGARMIVGVTATYRRGDGVSVAHEDYFPTCAVWNTVAQLTEMGYLVPAHGHYVYTNIDLKNVARRAGDFDEEELSRTVNTPERNRAAVEGWRRVAANRATVAFCVDVRHARDLADCFSAAGVKAAAVWGAMPREEYEEVMSGYRSGEIRLLANARLLIEGWDVPETSCVLIARPATPAAACVLGPQMIGRALRPSPATGKTDAVILELRDLGGKGATNAEAAEHPAAAESLIAAALDLPEEMVASGKALHEQSWLWRERQAWLERQRLLESLCEGGFEEMFDVIERITQASAYAWVPLGATLYMDLGAGDFIEIVADGPGCYEVRAAVRGSLTTIAAARDRERAISLADGWLARRGVNEYLHHRRQDWRKLKPTPVQIAVAANLTGRPRAELERLSRGCLSDLITTARALARPPLCRGAGTAAQFSKEIGSCLK